MLSKIYSSSFSKLACRICVGFFFSYRPNLFTSAHCQLILCCSHSRLKLPRTSFPVLSLKVKVHTLDIAPLRSESPPQKRSGMARVLKGFQFYLHTHTFIRNRNESCLPLPSQPQLVLIYRPRRDGRLSRPRCEVAQAEIRTHNLPIANLALYHTATNATFATAVFLLT